MRGNCSYVCLLTGSIVVMIGLGRASAADADVAKLAKEVAKRGWIVYGAGSPQKGMDLWMMRPDGSDKHRVTNTPEFYEGAPRLSPDGRKMLYRRVPRGRKLHHNQWGAQGNLVLADADGSNPVVLGKEGEFAWASWSPDGKKMSYLTRRGIRIVDLATKEVLRRLPRKGIYQQLFWSPDGKWFCGVSSAYGEQWTVVRMNAKTGELNALNKFSENTASHGPGSRGGAECTPDWFPDSKHVLFSHFPIAGGTTGYTQLWMADGEGKRAKFIFGQDGRHIYGGCLSPDGKYVLFNRVRQDGAAGLYTGDTMGLMRFDDAPTIAGNSLRLRKLHPEARDGPVLTLPIGWEPDWTYAEIGPKR